MPSAEPITNRRGVLVGGAALAALGLLASGCHEAPHTAAPGTEDLQGPLDQARNDSALAAAAAGVVGAPPQIAAALTVVANQRNAHAQALSTEIARAAGKLAPTTSETPHPSPAAPGPPKPPPPLSDVVNALRASAESAARLVATSSGYRAGLLGSIAASCTASYMVALVPGKPGS